MSAPASPAAVAAPVITMVGHEPPHAGDRWPCHLCMPSVVWPAPPGPVLRPDTGYHHPAVRRVSGATVFTLLLFWLLLLTFLASELMLARGWLS